MLPVIALVPILRGLGAERPGYPNTRCLSLSFRGKSICSSYSEHGLQHRPNDGQVVFCGLSNGDYRSEVGNRQHHVSEVLTRGDQIMR